MKTFNKIFKFTIEKLLDLGVIVYGAVHANEMAKKIKQVSKVGWLFLESL